MQSTTDSPFPYWGEVESLNRHRHTKLVLVPFEYEPELSNYQQVTSLPARPVVLEVTYTKHLTQRYKRYSDGRLNVFPTLGVAKLEDIEGSFLASADLGGVLSLVDRWNAAAKEGKGLEVTKGFGAYLVYIPEVSILIQSRHPR